MAFYFGGSSLLYTGSTPLPGGVFHQYTVFCWLRSTITPVADMACWSSGDSFVGGSSYEAGGIAGAVASDPLYLDSVGAVNRRNITTAGVTANQWHTCVARFAAADLRHLNLDCAGYDGDTGFQTMPALEWWAIGALRKGAAPAVSAYFTGDIAEVAVWDVSLEDAVVFALCAGYAPDMIRPASLIAYWPLIDDAKDRVGGYNLTLSGTPPTLSAHPPITYRPYTMLGPPGVGGSVLRTLATAGAGR